MKKIGLVGGLGPASTVDYYLGLVEKHRSVHGEDNYPQIVIDSVNMHEVTKAFAGSDYDGVAEIILKSLHSLKNAGAEIAAVTANTVHIAWDCFAGKSPFPLVNIVDVTADYIANQGYKRVLVLGTEFTMKSGLYGKSLSERGITPIVPSGEDIKRISGLFFPNLENGIVVAEDKRKMLAIAGSYIRAEKADALLLGCTELPLMIKDGDVSVPLVNTTEIHIDAVYRAAEGK